MLPWLAKSAAPYNSMGFTGTKTDSKGRRYTYQNGKRVANAGGAPAAKPSASASPAAPSAAQHDPKMHAAILAHPGAQAFGLTPDVLAKMKPEYVQQIAAKMGVGASPHGGSMDAKPAVPVARNAPQRMGGNPPPLPSGKSGFDPDGWRDVPMSPQRDRKGRQIEFVKPGSRKAGGRRAVPGVQSPRSAPPDGIDQLEGHIAGHFHPNTVDHGDVGSEIERRLRRYSPDVQAQFKKKYGISPNATREENGRRFMARYRGNEWSKDPEIINGKPQGGAQPPPLPNQSSYNGPHHTHTQTEAIKAGNMALSSPQHHEAFRKALHAHYAAGLAHLQQLGQQKYGSADHPAVEKAKQKFIQKLRTAWGRVRPNNYTPEPLATAPRIAKSFSDWDLAVPSLGLPWLGVAA